jgi:hydrogenase maturation protease
VPDVTGPGTRGVVLGVGNILNRDEGLGVFAVRALDGLLGEEAGAVVDLIDGGVLGLDLLPLVERCSHLLLCDAVNVGAEPGSVVELHKEEIPMFAGVQMSQHQVTMQEVLGLAAIRDRLPEHVHLVGVQPADLSIGLGLTPVVEAALPAVLERALAVLETWGVPVREAADV